MKNINGENLMAVYIHTLFITKELVKLFLNKIASVLVEQKNNVKNIETINDKKCINNIEDRLFLNKEIACPFCYP